MKKSLLTIALAVAALPIMFAKSQVPPPANSGNTTKPAVTAKKHSRKHVKKVAPKTTGTPAATPAAGAAVKPSK
jgi:hypothetical protein